MKLVAISISLMFVALVLNSSARADEGAQCVDISSEQTRQKSFLERTVLDYLNLGTVRNLKRQQSPPSQVSKLSISALAPSNYAVLSNPGNFNGQMIYFTGYLHVTTQHNFICREDGRPDKPCYHIYPNKDDFEHLDPTNFVHLELSTLFRHADLFTEGSKVTGVGTFVERKLRVDSIVLPGDFGVGTLKDGSMAFSTKNENSGLLRQIMQDPLESVVGNSTWCIMGPQTVSNDESISASGRPLIFIDRQSAELRADQIDFDKKSQTINAVGRVELHRYNKTIKYDKLSFPILSDKYLVTAPITALDSPIIFVSAR